MSLVVETLPTLAEAARRLSSDRGARFLAGGTLVMRALNEGDTSFGTILRTTDPALSRIEPSGDRVRLGAGVTMGAILASRELDFLHPVARAIGGPAVRNMATVGGNLFAEPPYGDFATALLALDAIVQVEGASEQPLERFLADRRGLVGAVTLRRPQRDAFRFLKVSRVKPKGIAVMTIAAHLPGAPGRIQGARVTYGNMGPRPQRAGAVEQALEGRALDASAILAAVTSALTGVSPQTDPIASEWYRRETAPVHLRRLLEGRA